jgi:hypothetical protein
MGKVYTELDERLIEWLDAQPMFFVGTAPTDGGHVNVSPKGLDGTFRVISATSVAYLDLIGSGAETIAHVRDNSRITLLFCAFAGPPRIVRLYGSARVVEPGDADYAALIARFADFRAPRSVIAVDLDRIADSCGFGVPTFDFVGQRSRLLAWSDHRNDEQLREYQLDKNRVSIDGLPALRAETLERAE